MTSHANPFDRSLGWETRTDFIVETMREVSRCADPEEMVAAYSRRMNGIQPGRLLSLSRRGVDPPRFVLARDSAWDEQVNPWRERDQLPVLAGGILGEVAYGNEVRLVQDLHASQNDPGYAILRDSRSLLAIPVFDGGEGLNTVVFLSEKRNAFDTEIIPMQVWTSNLFGRATHNLVLSRELERALRRLAQEAQLIADIQKSLLPRALPSIPRLDIAVCYKPAARAGGDYYDFFELDGGRWGFLVADVSGHGSPAAVEMAIVRTLAHAAAAGDAGPGAVLDHVNRNLVTRIGRAGGAFVTAFFAVFDPADLALRFASAGHHPPRVKRCSDGSLFTLACDPAPPLGVVTDQVFPEAETRLVEGDQMVLYTDGIVEAFDPDGVLFGLDRLDAVLENCGVTADALIESVLSELANFTRGREIADDITMVVARVKAPS